MYLSEADTVLGASCRCSGAPGAFGGTLVHRSSLILVPEICLPPKSALVTLLVMSDESAHDAHTHTHTLFWKLLQEQGIMSAQEVRLPMWRDLL